MTAGLDVFFLRLAPPDIAFVKFVFESYEGVAVVRTLDRGEAVVVNSASEQPWSAEAPISRLHLNSIVAAPIRRAGTRSGLTLTFTATGGHRFDKAQVSFANAVANQLALVLASRD